MNLKAYLLKGVTFMKSNDFVCWLGTLFGAICIATQTDKVLQYIQLGLTIFSTLVALIYTIWKWWRKAKEDGKITEDEVDDLMEDVHQIVNKKEGEKDD